MLRILRVIADNLERAPVTVRLPGSVPVPSGFRGRVILDPTRCLACGVCAYVCVSNAITGANEDKAYAWGYEPGRCTFCARCVDHCTGSALTMESIPVPVYSRLGELAMQQHVPFPACPGCGAPTRPLTEELLRRGFEYVEEDTRKLLRLCERCRRRRLQRNLIAAACEDSKESGR